MAMGPPLFLKDFFKSQSQNRARTLILELETKCQARTDFSLRKITSLSKLRSVGISLPAT